MTPNDRKKLIQTLTGVHDFYRAPLSEFAVVVWETACETFSVEQVTKALSAHLMDPDRGQFMPKPADVVRQLKGTFGDRGLIAWGKVLDAMQRVGGYESVCFDDPYIHAAIEDAGGWSKCCSGEMKDLPFLQKRFCDSHKAYAIRGDMASCPAKLVGRFELENSAKGHRVTPPVLIGDPRKAMHVLESGSTGPKTQITHIGAGVTKLLERLESNLA